MIPQLITCNTNVMVSKYYTDSEWPFGGSPGVLANEVLLYVKGQTKSELFIRGTYYQDRYYVQFIYEGGRSNKEYTYYIQEYKTACTNPGTYS